MEHAQPAPVKANLLAGYAGAKTVCAKMVNGRLAERFKAPVLEHAKPAPVKANLLAGYAGAKTGRFPVVMNGRLAERLKAPVLKTGRGASLS